MNDTCAKYVNFIIKATVIICASAGFDQTLERFDIDRELNRQAGEYTAVTIQHEDNYVVLFEEPISINNMAQQAQYIANFEEITGRDAANLVGDYTGLFIQTMVLENVEVYYNLPGKRHYLTKN